MMCKSMLIICVFIVFILSLFLKFIPMPVLYGVFLYMGVASLNGVQVTDDTFK